MKAKIGLCWAWLALTVASSCAFAETHNLNAEWRFSWAKETIPGHDPGDMSGAAYQWNTTDFNEVQGGLVGNVSLVVKKSKTYLTLPYYNNLKTIGTYVTAKDFDFGKGEATICVKAEARNEDNSRGGAEARSFKIKVEVREAAGLTQRCREAESAEALGKTFGTGSGAWRQIGRPLRLLPLCVSA